MFGESRPRTLLGRQPSLHPSWSPSKPLGSPELWSEYRSGSPERNSERGLAASSSAGSMVPRSLMSSTASVQSMGRSPTAPRLLTRQDATRQLSPEKGRTSEGIELAKKAIAATPWLKLRQGESDTLAKRGRFRQYARYSTITRGTPDRAICCHVVCSGRVQTVHAVTGRLCTLGPGTTFGEGAMVTGTALWPEHAVALEDSLLVQFSLADLEGVRLDMPMLRRETLATFLQKVYYFRDLRHDQRCAVGSACTFHAFPKGHVLYAPGQPSDRFFILIEGRVAIRPADRPAEKKAVEASSSNAGGGDDDDVEDDDELEPPSGKHAPPAFLEFKGGSDLSRGDSTPPWCGLAAVVDGHKTRTDGAVVLTHGAQMLEVAASHVLGAHGLQHQLPGFSGLAMAEASSYSVFENQTPKRGRQRKD